MKLLVLASGSGGHVYPALAFMRYAIKEGHEVLYYGIKNSFEERVVKAEIEHKVFLDIHSHSSYYLTHPLAYKEIKKALSAHKDAAQTVDAIVAFGGMMSIVGRAAAIQYHKPLYLHEQNARLGDGNIFAGHRARRIFTVFDDTAMPFYLKKKVRQSGNPRSLEARVHYQKNAHSKPHVLFFAGSLGSETLISTLKDVTNQLAEKYEVTVITGTKYYETFKKTSSANIRVINYADNLLALLAQTDVVVMRAGATSISEMMALEIPSILIPSPYVKHDHQRENARILRDKKIAFVVEEKNVTTLIISDYIRQVTSDFQLALTMKLNMNKLQNLYASKTILTTIKNEI